MSVSVGLAFVAGLASFLSPCVFSLVPAYIGYLGGRSLAATSNGQVVLARRWDTFSHGLAFVLGFSMVFVILGLAASAMGQLLYDLRPVLTKVGGVVVILFGLHMAHILRIPFLDYDLRPQSQFDESRSYLSSFLLGVFFSAGWAPCTGPVLGAILTLALNEGNISSGAVLLSAYSLGLAIPFLVAAIGIGWVTQTLRRYGRVMQIVETGMGVVLIIVGVMLFMGVFSWLGTLGTFINLGV
jgi:cytochrome c-type biogenesis protein